MVVAPPSWRAATKRAPSATIAPVTWKLPEPTTPKTWSTPARTSARPTASETFTAYLGSALDEGDGAGGGPGAGDDGQRTDDEHGTGGGQERDVLELGEAVLAAAHQEGMAGEGRVEGVRGARVGSHGLDADPHDRSVLGDPPGAIDAHAGRVRTGLVRVDEPLLAVGAGVPAGAVDHPATGGQRSVLGLPGADVVDLEQEVGVGCALGTEVEHHDGPDQPGHRDV